MIWGFEYDFYDPVFSLRLRLKQTYQFSVPRFLHFDDFLNLNQESINYLSTIFLYLEHVIIFITKNVCRNKMVCVSIIGFIKRETRKWKSAGDRCARFPTFSLVDCLGRLAVVYKALNLLLPRYSFLQLVFLDTSTF